MGKKKCFHGTWVLQAFMRGLYRLGVGEVAAFDGLHNLACCLRSMDEVYSWKNATCWNLCRDAKSVSCLSCMEQPLFHTEGWSNH